MTSVLPDHATGLGKLSAGTGGLGLWEQTVRAPTEGEVVLEVIASGICGTDLHIADDEFPSEPPVTMGHEVTGEVVQLGPGLWFSRTSVTDVNGLLLTMFSISISKHSNSALVTIAFARHFFKADFTFRTILSHQPPHHGARGTIYFHVGAFVP